MINGSAKAPRLYLPQVTLCAISSVNVAATIQALEISLSQVDVAAALLLTDSPVTPDHPGITVVPIALMSISAPAGPSSTMAMMSAMAAFRYGAAV